MVILVTGATGFIGSHLAKALLNHGHTLICPVRNGSQLPFEIDGKFVEYLEYDELINLSDLKEKNISLVIHLATSYGRESSVIGEIVKINYDHPMQLLNQCFSENIPFINTDTFFNVDFLQNNLKEYAFSKKLFLRDARSLIKGKNKLINLRLEHVYGPHDRNDKFIPWLIKNLLADIEEILLTDCIPKRDFIYVDDVINAYLKVVNSLDILNEGCFNFGVGAGVSVPVRLLVEKCHIFTNSKSCLAFGKKARDDQEIMDSYADNANLIALGWSSKVSLDEGLLNTIRYIKSSI
jgi:nucleoside-diphosphate-sugar epimerase